VRESHWCIGCAHFLGWLVTVQVMAVLHPEIFASKRVCVDVETKGELTRGATVADWKGHWGREANTTVLMGVDEATFHALYVKYIARYAPGTPLGDHIARLVEKK